MSLSGRLAAKIVQLRLLWVVISLVLVVIAASGARYLTLDPDARIFFAEENPDRIALDLFEAEFAKDDNLIFVLEPKDGQVFTPRTLGAIGKMTEASWLLPSVRRVNSVTNFQNTFAEGDDMTVRDLVEDPDNVSQEQADAAKAVALDRVSLVHALISPAADVTAVSVMFRLPGKDPAKEVPEIVAEARALADEFETAYPDIAVYTTGSVMVNNQFSESGQEDAATLTPLMFGMILLIVFLAFMSFVGMIMTMLVIMCSALVGLGALGWSGTAINSVTISAPLITMTLAVASVVHILASVRQTMVETDDRRIWAQKALEDHMGEVAIACTTTAIGFLALNFSISPPFRELGNVVAVGVIAALFFTLTLLPAMITYLPMKRHAAVSKTDRFMKPVAEFVIRKRKQILWAGTTIVVLLIAGIPRLALEDDFIRYFDERYEYRRDTDFYEARLGGLNVLEWALPSGEAEGISKPDYLQKVAAFTEWLRAQDNVRYVSSLTDTIARLNMNMHGDDQAFHRLPDNADEAAQYLFFYELSLGYGMDLTDQINVDKSKLRVSVSLVDVTTAQMHDFTDDAVTWLEQNAPEMAVQPTGIIHVFNQISYRDVRAMLSGTVLALIAISMLILLILRDVKLGLISLIPNLIPAGMAFGIWGYSVGAVTLAIAVVIAMTLGIVVDDTVHFLSKYKEGKRKGMSAEDAVRHAFDKVGMALIVTTLALVAGFIILAQSGFAVNGDMARLTAITITVALIADFLLLPAILIALDQRKDTMSMKKAAAAGLAVLIGTGAAVSETRAQTAEEKGLKIAQEADRRDLGWGNFRSKGQMILRDSGGNESRRNFDGLNLERSAAGEGDWSIIVFKSPRDIKGTATLTHSKVEPADDDQWIFLPAVKRVKRISSSNRTGKFVSSEFSFEDLGSQEVDDYTYKWLRDEKCPGNASLTCHVTESYPRNTRSGYSKRIAWTDTSEYRQWKVEFYNRRGDLEKALSAKGYQQYLGKFWRPDELYMENFQTGKSTTLAFPEYKFNAGLDEGDFNAQRLSRLAR